MHLRDIFLKVATTLVDLLFIELMSHLSHVKQMYSQLIHLTHELILCIQITSGRIYFNRDSPEKSPCGHQVSSICPSNPDLLQFEARPPLQDLAIFITPHGLAHWSKCLFKNYTSDVPCAFELLSVRKIRYN